ncbi:MAG: SPOR domain-containing protein [Nitrospiraceae bacterium]|nr:SPOR domain-containing protein [Nitrospiraceae bacterium]
MTDKIRKKVLVIDNDRVASDMIVKTLLPRGLDVSVAASPGRGVEKAREYKPDLIFISLFLPESNGFKISRRIHSDEELMKVPLMMLISYRGELDPKYTSSIGVVDVLVKPLKSEDIISKIEKVLGKQTFTEEPAGGHGIFFEGEKKEAIPLEEEGVLDTEVPLPVSPPEEETLHAADQPQKHDLSESKKEEYARDETEEFLKGEAEEEGQALADKEATEQAGKESEAAFAAPFASEEELFAVEKPRKFTSGKKIIVLAAVFAVLAVGLGTYGLKKIESRSEKAAPVKAAVAGRKKKAAAPDVAAARPVIPVPEARGEVTPQKEAVPATGEQYRFSVQIGAFGSEKHAGSLVEKMKGKGFDAFIEKDPTKPLYRVLVGRFGDPTQASRQAKMLRDEGLKAVVRPGKG